MRGFFQHFFLWLLHMGGVGMLLMGVLDSSFLFLPLGNDLLVLRQTAEHPHRLFYFALMATGGSLLGCAIMDWISRRGGEAGLERLLSKRQLGYVESRVKEKAGFALATAAVMPPPFPFTPFVVAAAAFQYPRKRFYGVLGVSRFIRFCAVGVLAIFFGRQILRLADQPWVRDVMIGLVVVCLSGSAFSIYTWIRRARTRGK